MSKILVPIKEGIEIRIEDVRLGEKEIVRGKVIKFGGTSVGIKEIYSITLDTGYRIIIKTLVPIKSKGE